MCLCVSVSMCLCVCAYCLSVLISGAPVLLPLSSLFAAVIACLCVCVSVCVFPCVCVNFSCSCVLAPLISLYC